MEPYLKDIVVGSSWVWNNHLAWRSHPCFDSTLVRALPLGLSDSGDGRDPSKNSMNQRDHRGRRDLPNSTGLLP